MVQSSWEFVHYFAKQNKYKNLPIFLWGTCFGATTILSMLLRHTKEVSIAGIILIAPLLKMKKLCQGEEWTKAWSRIDEVQWKRYSRPEYFNDELPEKTEREIIEMAGEVCEKLKCFNIPMLVMHGTGDQICEVDILKDLCYNNKSYSILKIFPGGYHSLNHDLCAKVKILSFVYTFL